MAPAVLVAGAIVVGPVSAAAQEAGTIRLTGHITALSDGIFRGVSQTEGAAQFTAGAQLAHSNGLYVGTLYKTMRDRATGLDDQYQLFVGYRTSLAGTDINGRVNYKKYNGLAKGTDDDLIEYEVTLGRKLSERFSGRLNMAYTPDHYGNRAKAASFAEIGLSYKASPKLTLQAANGFRHIENSTDYASYLAGAQYAVTPSFSAALNFTTTSERERGGKFDDTVFLTLQKRF
ncbi:MAG: TorF family putative porin [Asticcacaulis sp.]